MKKVNQSYSFCDDQIAWLKETFCGAKQFSKDERLALEKEFEETFDFYRSYGSLRVKAYRLGFRPSASKLEVGVSRKVGKKGECDYILISKEPIARYTPIDRYIWEKETGEKLTKKDIIINLNGVEHTPKIDSLRKITRVELIAMNRLPKDIPLETRYIMAQIKANVGSLEGRGEWSNQEMEWLFKHGKRDAEHNFWKKLAERFNREFDKKRTNRDLCMKYYLMEGG